MKKLHNSRVIWNSWKRKLYSSQSKCILSIFKFGHCVCEEHILKTVISALFSEFLSFKWCISWCISCSHEHMMIYMKWGSWYLTKQILLWELIHLFKIIEHYKFEALKIPLEEPNKIQCAVLLMCSFIPSRFTRCYTFKDTI